MDLEELSPEERAMMEALMQVKRKLVEDANNNPEITVQAYIDACLLTLQDSDNYIEVIDTPYTKLRPHSLANRAKGAYFKYRQIDMEQDHYTKERKKIERKFKDEYLEDE